MTRRRLGAALRAAVVTALAVLAVWGAAFVGAGEEAAAEPDGAGDFFGGAVPAYPGAKGAAPLGEGLELNGMPLRMATFVTDDPPDVVRDFYADAFAAEGLEVQSSSVAGPGAAVIAWDPERGVQRSVSILAQGGETLVFPALVPLAASKPARPRPLPPLPEDAHLVSDLVARDGGDESRTVSVVTPHGQPEAVQSLGTRLTDAGWRWDPAEATRAGAVITARGPDRVECTYVISGGPGRPTGVVAVLRRAP